MNKGEMILLFLAAWVCLGAILLIGAAYRDWRDEKKGRR